jgi:hypothetical protein
VAIGGLCHTHRDYYLVVFYFMSSICSFPYYSILNKKNQFGILSFCVFVRVSLGNCSAGNGKAFLQKDRLLQFDRDFARRTEVFDDQADYQSPSAWMTEEEKQEAEENQLKQLESLKRPKPTLNISI